MFLFGAQPDLFLISRGSYMYVSNLVELCNKGMLLFVVIYPNFISKVHIYFILILLVLYFQHCINSMEVRRR